MLKHYLMKLNLITKLFNIPLLLKIYVSIFTNMHLSYCKCIGKYFFCKKSYYDEI